MASKMAIPLLVAGMMVTGISNSIFQKAQDLQCVAHCDDPDTSRHVEFSQPVWQTANMFLGEAICLLPVMATFVYHRLDRRRWTKALRKSVVEGENGRASNGLLNDSHPHRTSLSANEESSEAAAAAPESEPLLPSMRRSQSADAIVVASDADLDGEEMTTAAAWLFIAPAACDICGTTLMNVGLLFTPISIYQMTRGALVLWVGIFSVIFLHRRLLLYQWLSLITVMLGVCVVGMSGTILHQDPEAGASALGSAANHSLQKGITPDFKGGDEELPEAVGALFGILLIIFANIFTAGQFVLEEKIMTKYSVDPLLAVGMEGIFGLVMTLVAQVVLHFTYGRTREGRGGYFDMTTGWYQIMNNPVLLWTSVAIAFSIGSFNFFGLSVTRSISAAARSTIDTCRTLGTWTVSLLLGWEVFRLLPGSIQILGFVMLCYGTLVFNGVIRPPKFLRPRRPRHLRRGTSRSRSRTRSYAGHRSETLPDAHAEQAGEAHAT